jgi:hypothetical protein
MKNYENTGEYMPITQVELAGHLPFGQGSVGQDCLQETAEEQAEFGQSLSPFVRPLTVTITADCVEDRPIAQIGNVTDPERIAQRVTYRYPGGLHFAVTKAAVGANLVFVKDAKNFKDAYERSSVVLTGFGYPNAGHNACGASGGTESSVANEVPTGQLMTALPALAEVDERTRQDLRHNTENKRQKLEDGYYGGWDSSWHADHIAETSSAHFSLLQTDASGRPLEHDAAGLLIVGSDGFGFATTDYNRHTGNMAFAITPKAKLMYDIADKICGSSEERRRFLLEVQGNDPAGVLNGLVVRGLPLYMGAVEG